MKKNWCSALGLWLLFLPLLTAQNLPTFHAQPQANPSAPDLHGTLSAYKIYRLNADALQAFLQEENGDPEKRFALDLPGAGLWSLRLQPRQLLAADYRLQVDDGQAVQYLPGPGQITWAGYQGAGAQFRATLTVNAGFIFGSVQTPAGEFFIEPLYDLAPGAAPDLFIVYNTADVLPNPDLKCGVEEVRKKKAETQQPAPERLVGQCKHAEIAIASDYGMFTRYTNSTGVQNHNIGVMNSVATDYDDAFDDDIYFLITTQYVSSTSTSSLDVALTSTTDASILLDNFRVWGNAGNFGFDFDLATLWVTRNICSGSNCSTIGLAYVGALCDNFRYHLLEDYTGSNPNGTGWQLRVLTSHEIGHNFDCSHDPSGSNTIMAPSVNNTSTWSAQSEGEVAAYLPTITCLSLCGANFSSTSYAAGEGNGGLTLPAGPPSCEMPYVELAIPIQYSGPNTGGSVDVTVVGGTATEYLDFDLPSATVVFPAGFTTQTVNLIVRIWNDAISEGSETIELQLNGPSAGSQNMTTVTIVSDDANPTTSYYTFGQVGTGNAGGLNVPFRANNTDCRTQIILGASELSAAGFSANDIINGLALDVSSKSSTQPFNGFTIKMQHTTSGPTYTGQPANSGFTTVFSGNHTTSTGWNKFDFTQGFVWNGTSNLRIEFCFDNSSTSPNHDFVRTSNGATAVFVAANSGSGCTLPTSSWSFYSNNRPNVRLYKGNEIAVSLGDVAYTNLKNGNLAYFKDLQNQFVLTIQQTAGADAGCVQVEIDRAGNGRQTPTWLPAGYYVSDKTFFVTADDPTASYDITLYYSKAEITVWGSGANSLNIVKSTVPIADATASDVSINETVVRSTFGPSSNPDAYYSYRASFSGFSGFAVTNATEMVLPVEWLHFSGQLAPPGVLLDWSTAAEQHNLGFEVERSEDGSLFSKIGFVPGRGTAAAPAPYQFTDAQALQQPAPVLYYRLKQLDADGAFAFSKIISVALPRMRQGWDVSPNPSRGLIRVLNEDCPDCFASLSILDASGRVVFRQETVEPGSSIDLSALAQGVYLFRILGREGQIRQGRLVRN